MELKGLFHTVDELSAVTDAEWRTKQPENKNTELVICWIFGQLSTQKKLQCICMAQKVRSGVFSAGIRRTRSCPSTLRKSFTVSRPFSACWRARQRVTCSPINTLCIEACQKAGSSIRNRHFSSCKYLLFVLFLHVQKTEIMKRYIFILISSYFVQCLHQPCWKTQCLCVLFFLLFPTTMKCATDTR